MSDEDENPIVRSELGEWCTHCKRHTRFIRGEHNCPKDDDDG